MCGDNLLHHRKNFLTYRLRVAACRGKAGITRFRDGLPQMLAINQTDLDPAGKAREQLWLPEIDRADGVVNDHAVQIMNLLVDIRIVRQHRGDKLPERRVCAQKPDICARLQAEICRVESNHDGFDAA